MKKFLIYILLFVFILLTTPTTFASEDFEISSNRAILDAIETIKSIPNGENYYDILSGENPYNRPYTVEFADLSTFGKQWKDMEILGWLKQKHLFLYINNKYIGAPKEVLATLIVSRLANTDSIDSINEEVYCWTTEALLWTYFTHKNPDLEKIPYPIVQKRLNLLKEMYEKANYQDTYIRILVKTNNAYKNLPESSPGFEKPKVVDNSMFDVITPAQVQSIITEQITNIESVPFQQEKVALKGIFYDEEISVNQQKYDEKIKNDNPYILQNKKNLSSEQYHLYTIMEKIIRSNNIDFIPWRLVIENDYEINAASTDTNLVIINRGLYNAFKHNDDALAFILSHELSHLLLNHLQITEEHNRQINDVAIRSANRQANMYAGMDAAYNVAGDNTASMVAAIGFGAYALINGIQANTDQLLIDKIYAAERDLEYAADNEGFNLMYRAGYNLGKAAETFEVLSRLPNVYTRRSTHPPVRDRYINLMEVGSAMNLSLKNEGKNNIINSSVLSAHSDKEHTFFYIDKCKNYNRNYHAETDIERKQRLADSHYRNNRLPEAIFYLKILAKAQPNNFVHPLRISYANEYLYRTRKESKYSRQAKSWAKKASKIAPNDEYVKEQLKSVKSLK